MIAFGDVVVFSGGVVVGYLFGGYVVGKAVSLWSAIRNVL